MAGMLGKILNVIMDRVTKTTGAKVPTQTQKAINQSAASGSMFGKVAKAVVEKANAVHPTTSGNRIMGGAANYESQLKRKKKGGTV